MYSQGGYDKLIYSDVMLTLLRRVNQNTLRLLWSGTSLEGNLNSKYVAKRILLPKSFRLSYLTPPLPLLVFAVQRENWLAKLFTQESTIVIKSELLSF